MCSSGLLKFFSDVKGSRVFYNVLGGYNIYHYCYGYG